MAMDHIYLSNLLKDFKEGRRQLDDVLEALKKIPYEDLGFAKIDHHRSFRKGFPEVIFCQGKTAQQVVEIFSSLAECNRTVLGTRAGPDIYEAVKARCPEARYHREARMISLERGERGESAVREARAARKEDTGNSGAAMLEEKPQPKITVVTAGTADIPVAEEAAVTADFLGHNVERIYDAGVAGIHRLLAYRDNLHSATVIIVVAGMEGALPSVVGGLVDVPVIAVPTSIGYGANFNGLSALLAMLNSCANGIGVVNIDNGFGAATLADSIIRSASKLLETKRRR